MQTEQRACAIDPGLPDRKAFVVRDMILLALDETEAAHLPEVNRLAARSALAEALDLLEGEA